MDKTKSLGQIFTPDYIVDMILNDVGYKGGIILNSRILEPSFGNGVFLQHIIERIINEGRLFGLSDAEIASQIENNVYGIEIDEQCCKEAESRLYGVLESYGITGIHLNLYNRNALDCHGSFDFIVGNPPYVRIHNIDSETRETINDYRFSSGMKDMYVIFFEHCLNQLKPKGKLAFITPNSYLKNTSQGEFRKYLLSHNLVEKIENFSFYQVFPECSTYTCITVLNNDYHGNSFTYSSVWRDFREYCYQVPYDRFKQDGEFTTSPWNLAREEEMNLLDEIRKRNRKVSDVVTVQCGFATNKDKVYISKELNNLSSNTVLFNDCDIEKDLIHLVVKPAKYHGERHHWILFPYRNGSVIPEDKLRSEYPLTYEYLLKHRAELDKRDMEQGVPWYAYARSQGIRNCTNEKLIINHVVSSFQKTIEAYLLPEDVFVYSGMFITGPHDALVQMQKILQSEEFCRYAKLAGKNMSGGYISLSTTAVKEYRIP